MKTQDLFADYPDLVNVKQFQTMMGGISVKAVYQCLHDGDCLLYTSDAADEL